MNQEVISVEFIEVDENIVARAQTAGCAQASGCTQNGCAQPGCTATGCTQNGCIKSAPCS